MSTTRVALIQMSCEPSTEANLSRAVARVREAALAGANLICLPELFRAQYFCQREDHALFSTAEAIPGPSTAALSEVVREHKIVLVASLFERRAPGLYHNTAAILDHTAEAKDNIAAIYRKMHIPDDPLYYEKFTSPPATSASRRKRPPPAPSARSSAGTSGIPEGARITALKGAETLFFPTAIGWHPSEKAEFGERQYDAWQTIQRAHAIANGVFVCAVNRVGHEQGDVLHDGTMMRGPEGAGLEFWGGSFIADPFGRILAKASHDKEEILYADLDSKEVEVTRQHWPFLRDRRIDAYGGITSRFLD